MDFESYTRLFSFLGVFAVLASWELVAPRRPLSVGRGSRWFANLSLVVIGNAAARFIIPIFPVGMAFLAREKGWGVLNIVELPWFVEGGLAFLLLDFAIYLQHVVFHFQPLLWRLHRMHHSDLDLDVTSGNRFHPLEILLSLAIKLGAVILIGASPGAVLFFEVILNASSMFNHGNVLIPVSLDRWLRILVVTPDMHRVHHSVIPMETNSNFGFCLPWWDRLCNTYKDQPEAGHEGMIIGLREFRTPERLKLHHLIIQPFISARSYGVGKDT
jgi:sterol desaturase/sphingolipid hydroxylase (fatty acid hydroxylase superfamily)